MNAELSAVSATRIEELSQAVSQPAAVVPTRYVLLPVAALATGYTVKAMERKIERGDWVEGKVWRRAPDGRILIDLVGYHKWVENA